MYVIQQYNIAIAKFCPMNSPSLFVLTVLVTLFIVMGEAGPPSHIRYSTVPGYFLQDDPNTDDSNFNYVHSVTP